MWELNNTSLNNTWVKEDSSREIKEYLDQVKIKTQLI